MLAKHLHIDKGRVWSHSRLNVSISILARIFDPNGLWVWPVNGCDWLVGATNHTCYCGLGKCIVNNNMWLQLLYIMPPKKAKLLPGHRTLTGVTASSSGSSASDPTPTACSSQWKCDVDSWRHFAERKWKERFPWLDVWVDGVYCTYMHCQVGTAHDVATHFLTKGYMGTRPNLLTKHKNSSLHSGCAITYRKSLQHRSAKHTTDNIIRFGCCLTVDGEEFCDGLHYLYFLAKSEISPTTTFVPLLDLCVRLGNS